MGGVTTSYESGRAPRPYRRPLRRGFFSARLWRDRFSARLCAVSLGRALSPRVFDGASPRASGGTSELQAELDRGVGVAGERRKRHDDTLADLVETERHGEGSRPRPPDPRTGAEARSSARRGGARERVRQLDTGRSGLEGDVGVMRAGPALGGNLAERLADHRAQSRFPPACCSRSDPCPSPRPSPLARQLGPQAV